MGRPLVQNAGDEQQVKRAARLDRLRAAQSLADRRALMQLPAFRRWITELQQRAGVRRAPFTPGQPDLTAFRAGEQNIGLWIEAQLVEADEDLYLQMQIEARAEQKRKDQATEASHTARADEAAQEES